jgi:hypothetical protein
MLLFELWVSTYIQRQRENCSLLENIFFAQLVLYSLLEQLKETVEQFLMDSS